MRKVPVSFVAFGRGSNRRTKADAGSEGRRNMKSYLLLRKPRQDRFHSAIAARRMKPAFSAGSLRRIDHAAEEEDAAGAAVADQEHKRVVGAEDGHLSAGSTGGQAERHEHAGGSGRLGPLFANVDE